MVIDPSLIPLLVVDVSKFIRMHKTFKMLLNKYKMLAKRAKLPNFTGDTNWQDWEPSFKNLFTCYLGK